MYGHGLRKAHFNLLVTTMAAILETAAQFLEIFNQMVLRSIDHGLLGSATPRHFVRVFHSNHDEIHIKTFVFSYKTFICTFLSYIFSLCVFINEVYFDKLRKFSMNASWQYYKRKLLKMKRKRWVQHCDCKVDHDSKFRKKMREAKAKLRINAVKT